MFSEKDRNQIRSKGQTESSVLEQINRLREGYPSLKIVKSATVNDGILALKEDELSELIDYYNKNSECLKKVKFVPASGAASRMFKYLFEVLNSLDKSENDYHKILENQNFGSLCHIYENREKLAIFNDLERLLHSNLPDNDGVLNRKNILCFLKNLLSDDGLNYGILPKGLLKFHKQCKGSRTPVEEHLVEGACYAKSGKEVNMHFSVSENHLELFKNHFEEVVCWYEKEYGVTYNIQLSVQESSTDKIAIDLDNTPFRDNEGNLVFRPGGHGALLQNLNEIFADLIYVKNIDNVVQDRVKKDTVMYKKAMAGLLIKLRKETFDWLMKLNEDDASKYISEAKLFVSERLNIKLPFGFDDRSEIQKVRFLIEKLNRPIRVCGMVSNDGEPGGGPFWVENNDNSVSLQIVERSQIDEAKKDLMINGTHFNSVDLVCSISDYEGNQFDLNKYIDPETGFISQKSLKGRALKALELPGLWNGAMSDWNTIFVEVPDSTFSPVKEFSDLLKEEHLCEKDLRPG